jgi:hypothetical protein
MRRPLGPDRGWAAARPISFTCGAPSRSRCRVGFAIPTTGNIGSALPGGRLGQGAAALAMIFKLAEVPRKTASPNAKIG